MITAGSRLKLHNAGVYRVDAICIKLTDTYCAVVTMTDEVTGEKVEYPIEVVVSLLRSADLYLVEQEATMLRVYAAKAKLAAKSS